MASRRFFAYDPYDYYYSTPYHYSYPYYHHPAAAAAARAHARDDDDADAFFFPGGVESPEPAVRAASRPRRYDYHHQPAPARNDGAFFSDVESPEPAVRAAAEHRHHPRPRSSRSVSVPVRFVGSESELEPEREAARSRVPPVARMADAAVSKKREQSAEEAAVRVQAAARGFMARRMVREVRAVEREAEGVATRVAAEAEALRGDARGRVAVGEALMRLLLRLDAVRGVREYRRRVTKRVLALQDAVDALEPKSAPVMDAPVAADAMSAERVEMAEAGVAEESGMAPELPHAPEHGAEIGAKTLAESPAAETAAEMEVDGGRAIGGEADHDVTESVVEGEKAEAAEGEWEMVTEDDAVAGDNPLSKSRQQEPAAEEKEKKTDGGAADGLDAKKVMEMVAALCQRSTQQCVMIGALAERVDALERAVRRVEEADRRRRRSKKLKKDGKGNSKAARSCYSD